MLIGQTLNSLGDDNEVIFFTPWFPIQADSASFTYERIHSTLSYDEAVQVYSKTAEDAGSSPGSVVATFSAFGTTGLLMAECAGLKELVRFKVTISGDIGWVHFRFLPPTWYPEAEA